MVCLRYCRYRHIRQAVITIVRRDALLALGRRYAFALEVIVAATRDTGDRAGTVVIASRYRIGFALLYLGGYSPPVDYAVDFFRKVIQKVGGRAKAEVHHLVSYGVPRGL